MHKGKNGQIYPQSKKCDWVVRCSYFHPIAFFFLMFHTLCLLTFRVEKEEIKRSNHIYRSTLALCLLDFKTNTLLYIGKAKVKGPCCKMKDEIFDSPGRAWGQDECLQ